MVVSLSSRLVLWKLNSSIRLEALLLRWYNFFAYVFYKRYKRDVFHKKCGRSPLKTSLSFGKSYSFLFLLFIFSFLVNLFNTTHSIQQSVKEAIEQVQVEIKANHTALLVNLLFTWSQLNCLKKSFKSFVVVEFHRVHEP